MTKPRTAEEEITEHSCVRCNDSNTFPICAVCHGKDQAEYVLEKINIAHSSGYAQLGREILELIKKEGRVDSEDLKAFIKEKLK